MLIDENGQRQSQGPDSAIAHAVCIAHMRASF
jgi:hypothetical protein